MLQMPQQVCTMCVMDTTDPDIEFNNDGVCNYCREFESISSSIHPTEEESEYQLKALSNQIKAAGRGHEYDSVLGMSGGVDSSYVAYLAERMGLRPLVVHFDNGWNSEVAVQNVFNMVDKLGFELYSYVIDWEEFKDLQRSFFKASVIDIEMLTDHAILAAMFKISKEHNIGYILSGNNMATESGLPKAWYWNKQDLTNIKAIQKRFGSKELRSFPTMNIWQCKFTQIFRPFTVVEPLNLISYRKTKAIELLSSQFDWQYYGGKHYESIFTKFYQAYILPEKFGIDKRKAHFSSLIRNGEMTREEALDGLKQPSYDSAEIRADREYVLKKLDFSEEEFDRIMKLPIRSHLDYPSEIHIVEWFNRVVRLYRKMKKLLAKRAYHV
jgi:N-acetyl sugar amidotransferase